MEVCQSFILDNGAFTQWKRGDTPDWDEYELWVRGICGHPGFDWCLIPDVIGGSEDENNALIKKWPLDNFISVPVWHMHESIERLAWLCDGFPRVAFGSSGRWKTPGTPRWWGRMAEAMEVACDSAGVPKAKLHILRGLDPAIFTKGPFSSADSSNIGQNTGKDNNWHGRYQPASREVRAIVIRDRIEAFQSAPVWNPAAIQREMFMDHVPPEMEIVA